MAIMETFIVWGLPVLQSLVATGISHIALKDLYSDDGSDKEKILVVNTVGSDDDKSMISKRPLLRKVA